MPLPAARADPLNGFADVLELTRRKRSAGEREIEPAQQGIGIEGRTGRNVVVDIGRRDDHRQLLGDVQTDGLRWHARTPPMEVVIRQRIVEVIRRGNCRPRVDDLELRRKQSRLMEHVPADCNWGRRN